MFSFHAKFSGVPRQVTLKSIAASDCFKHLSNLHACIKVKFHMLIRTTRVLHCKCELKNNSLLSAALRCANDKTWSFIFSLNFVSTKIFSTKRESFKRATSVSLRSFYFFTITKWRYELLKPRPDGSKLLEKRLQWRHIVADEPVELKQLVSHVMMCSLCSGNYDSASLASVKAIETYRKSRVLIKRLNR